jgi:hypothetical protein
MADTKITALTALTAADPANDVIPIVDVSDTTMAASGTTKKISVNNILGASGTATLASATITGDLTVDTSTLKVDSTNNAVGIGTAVAPVYSSKLRVEGGVEIHTSQALNIQPGNTNPYEIVNRSAGGFAFYPTGSSLGLTLAPSGNLSLANGDLVMTTSGKGIDFSATASGSGTMTSELLNDYEEGTWVGTITGSTTNPTIPVTATGRYTKVGRQVSVQISFEGVSTIGALGDIAITGLPFANAALRAIGTAGTHTGATFTGTLISQISSTASSIEFYGVISNIPWAAATHNPNASVYFWANLTYTV